MNLDALDAKDLRLLTDAAVAVLAEGLGGAEPDRLADLPVARARAELATELAEAGAGDANRLATALGEGDRVMSASRLLLGEVLSRPDLALEVTAAFERRKSMMALDAGLVSGPVLLAIILVRLKRVRIGRDGLDVELSEGKGLSQLLDLLRKASGDE